MNRLPIFLLVFFVLPLKTRGVQVLSELDFCACEEFRLTKGLRVYKDPSLFIGSLGQMYNDPQQGWQSLMNETPILTTLQGTVYLMKLGGPSEFKNFGIISKLYELVDPRLRDNSSLQSIKNSKPQKMGRALVVPIKICGPIYGDSLGFVLVSDFERSLKEEIRSGVLPPSIYPNPIPKLKKP